MLFSLVCFSLVFEQAQVLHVGLLGEASKDGPHLFCFGFLNFIWVVKCEAAPQCHSGCSHYGQCAVLGHAGAINLANSWGGEAEQLLLLEVRAAGLCFSSSEAFRKFLGLSMAIFVWYQGTG